MLSRRRLLQLAGGTVAATAGCLDRSGPSTVPTGSDAPDRSIPDPVDDGPRTTPGDVPEWTPEWTLPFGDWQVLGLDTAGDHLFATLSRNDGSAAVAAVDPETQSVSWQTEAEGEAVGGSHATSQGIARGGWGVTLTADSVYLVAGRTDDRLWSAVHALDRASGERRWSVDRERELAVAGTLDGLVVATGLEFFPPADQTPISHQTPESPLSTVVYGLDAADGTVRWQREFVAVADVAVGSDGVFVGTGDRLVGLDGAGETRFTYDRGPATRVVAAADRVFYLTGDEETATLHGVAPNGDGDWQYDFPADELLLDGDRCYAAGHGVAAVEADGTVAWRDDAYGQWLLLDPDRDTLYTRAGKRADGATAYDAAGEKRWTFDPPSNNAWPEAATNDALAATAITGDNADEPFYTVYAVDAEGEATASVGIDTVFDALGLDGTIYLADGVSQLVALDP